MLQRQHTTKSPNKQRKNTNLCSRCRLVELLLGNDDRPGLAGLAEHLLGLEGLTLLENHGPYALGRRGRGVEDFLHSVDEGDGDLRRLVVGPALDEDLTGRVRLLRLASVALCQELHARRCAWIQCIELDLHSRQELQHSLFLSDSVSRVWVSISELFYLLPRVLLRKKKEKKKRESKEK